MQWDFFIMFIVLIIAGITLVCSAANCGVIEHFNRKDSKEYKISKILALISGLILVSLIIIISIL